MTAPILSPRLAVRVVLPFAAGYFMSFLLRTVNAVIAPDLIHDLGLSAADLGLLTSAYFLAFGLFQIPLGILLDHFGPRRTEAVLLLVAAVGAVIFGAAESVGGLLFGRALIGLGVSACLMAAFTAFALWFRGERLPFVNGIQLAAGGLGGLAATAPVEALLQYTDWRGLFTIMAVLATAAAALIYFVVPERPRSAPRATQAEQWTGVRKVFASAAFWRVAPLTVASQSTFLAVQSLWSGPWLQDVGGLSRAATATYLFLIAAAVTAGFLGLGTIAERLSRRGVPTVTVALGGTAVFTVAIALLTLQWTAAVLPLWIVFGFFGTSCILMYPVLSRTFPRELAGRVNTGLNLLVFLGAFAIQWGVGAIVDLWPPTANGGYATAGYSAAFGVLVVLQIAGFVWFALRRSCRLDPA